jgi:hypothetical protein
MEKAVSGIMLTLLILTSTLTLAFNIQLVRADGTSEPIKVWGFTSPRNRAPLLDPAGNAPTDIWGSSNIVRALKDPTNFGPGGIVPSPVQFVLPFVTTITPNSLVDAEGRRTVDVFFAGLLSSPTTLSDEEAMELARFLMAGGVLYISGNTGEEGPGYNKLFEVLGATDRFSLDTVWTGNFVETSTPISTPITNGVFGVVGPLLHTPFRAILPGTHTTGVAMGYASTSYILAEGRIGLGYISITGDPLYFNFFTGPDPDNLRYFLNLVALARARAPTPQKADLDVTWLPIEFLDVGPPFLPNSLKIVVPVLNKGGITAKNPVVEFYLNGEQIASVNLAPIEPMRARGAEIEWIAESNMENCLLEVRARLMDQEDANPLDNTVTKVFSFYFVDTRYDPPGFRHDRDAFSFPNWGYRTWQREYWEELWNFLIKQGLESDWATIVATPVASAIFSLFGAGHCYGMATSASIYYKWPELKPVDKPTFAMTEDEAKPDIIERQWEQLLHVYPIMWSIYKGTAQYNAAAEYEKILHLIKDKNEPAILTLINPGHAVVAYKILEISNDEKRVFVYENNRPYDDPADDYYLAPEKRKDRDYYVTFKPLSNEALYSLGGYTWNRICAFSIWQSIPVEEIIDHIEFILESWFRNLKEKGLNTLRIRCPVVPLIMDEYGRRIGYVDGTFINEIVGAEIEEQLDSYLFYLPSNLTYSVNITGIETATLGIDFVMPVSESSARIVIFENIPISPGSVITTNIPLEEFPTEVILDTGEIVKPKSIGEIDASDIIHPTTLLTIGEPNFVIDKAVCLTSTSSISLTAEDNIDGSGIASTAYRIYNASYDSGWINYTQPFYLIGLSDGAYYIDFNSTDYAGNVEPTNTVTVILDNSGPLVNLLNPPAGWALQDGVTFIVDAADAGSGVSSVSISVREADGGEGRPVGFEDLPLIYNSTTGKWTLFFNTLQLPDGYYIIIVKAKDNLGNTCHITVQYSIRNWAVIELLPASENNKAGRTMPVKFALRVAASVDPGQPFVYNEELIIEIYSVDDPSNILQTSTFGDTAQDYRINTVDEHYITNFRTLKTPKTYVVEIYRKGMLISTFEFSTVK